MKRKKTGLDSKGVKTLPHVFWEAFAGNQPEKYVRLRTIGLPFEGRSYGDVWRYLETSNRVEKLVDAMRNEVEGRLLPDNLIELRDLFWDDKLPTWDQLLKFDPHCHRSWVEVQTVPQERGWRNTVTAWSAFANFYFQYVDR
jgi:hypothetical protein